MNRNEYYSDDSVLFEIVKCLGGRETVFLGKKNEEERITIRCIKAHSVKFLVENMKAFNFLKYDLNIYYSLAHLYNMPMFSFFLKERKEQQAVFNDNFLKYMMGFDFAIDFDNHLYDEATKMNKILPTAQVLEDVKTVVEVFDDYKIPYSVRCSGSGFHINIESKHFEPLKINNELQLFASINKKLSDIFILQSICGSTKAYDKRMIWKCPYSHDYKSGNVALPLSPEQVENFDFQMVKPETVIKNGIRDRGILERKGSSKGIMDFVREYLIVEEEIINEP
jgi:hypothetical protein